MHSKHIQHLYWRACFGILPKQQYAIQNYSRKEVVVELLKSTRKVKPIKIDLSHYDGVSFMQFKNDKNLRKNLAAINREKIRKLNTAWINSLMNNGDLTERMTLFWANHFSCEDSSPVYMQQFINVLRKHALGDFGDFIRAVSKSAAMIRYLNNNQNKKSSPNENFARELLELFTLGIGHYSENDIKECARAFTGHGHNFEGKFFFRAYQHDYGVKFFLGRSGGFDGNDIIDIILKEKQCARFICEKIYCYFVNQNLVKEHINQMVEVFYGNYNIAKLMRFVFMSNWFYDNNNIGTKIKSPIDLLAGIYKTIPVEFEDEKDIFKIQYLLGQVLLKPPNVAGWEGGSSWIDVNTIMVRLRLPSLLLNHAQIPYKAKGDFNDAFRDYYTKKNKNKLPFKVKASWDYFFKSYGHYSNTTLRDNLINSRLSEGTRQYLDSLSKVSQRDFCVQLMSIPEYQMC
ncbi:DUF1800 domain-containing protein [Ichthyenterobacterium sp. W332]|uniref:DUF1800 domain-containing protein n=1 Tax=Microcosmobacter mediterraneus TaxID=3075607 RepID=A0ABU2YKH7_9FLAO|nr:DUF1800 domain-containing protein [Ichthyenterobacterium sp. W332]MDT0558194.1 DUF1800 domain-containing protein [Ichthyenterobacterium sp. W332]